MKTFATASLGLFFAVSTLTASARETATRYQFTEGETNAYAVEFSVRSEAGSEVSTGTLFVVTKAVTTNSAKLFFRTSFKSETKRTPSRGPGFGGFGGFGFYPGGMMQNLDVCPNDCEIEFDLHGHEIRDGGDYVLAAPLGKLAQSLFPPLPAKSGETLRSTVAVLDDPLWLGSADSFLNVRQPNGQPVTMGYYYFNGQRGGLTTLAVAQETTATLKKSPDGSLAIKQQSKFESPVRTGSEPRFSATLETDSTFDGGSMAGIETTGDVISQTETASRHAKVLFKAHRLDAAELAVALAPPPPPAPPRKLSANELGKILEDLKSSDLETRRAAVRQLNGVDVDSPSDEFMTQIAAMALDSDSFVHMTIGNFLGAHSTTNEVPVLLKLLKDSDWSTRSAATKALGRLKDPRAIQPLADLIARGSNMGFQDASSALLNIGAPAEKAVIGLLNEHNAETQRQACSILQQIGTGDSLDALQKLVTDSDQQLSQAAVEAVRAIKLRQ